MSTGHNYGDKTSPIPRMIQDRHHVKSMYDGSKEIPLPDELHAEVDCLKSCPPGADTLVVARFRKDGSIGCAKPCNVCRKYAELRGIRTIYYSDEQGQFRRMKL